MLTDRFGRKVKYVSSSCEEVAGIVTPILSPLMLKVIGIMVLTLALAYNF